MCPSRTHPAADRIPREDVPQFILFTVSVFFVFFTALQLSLMYRMCVACTVCAGTGLLLSRLAPRQSCMPKQACFPPRAPLSSMSRPTLPSLAPSHLHFRADSPFLTLPALPQHDDSILEKTAACMRAVCDGRRNPNGCPARATMRVWRRLPAWRARAVGVDGAMVRPVAVRVHA